MKVADFDFDLPADLIAQAPPADRGGSRLLLIDRRRGSLQHQAFSSLPTLLAAGDVLVVNDSRVLPARLLGRRVLTGGTVECLLLERVPAGPAIGPSNAMVEEWACLLRAGGRLRAGTALVFERDGVRIDAEVVAEGNRDRRVLRLHVATGTVLGAIERVGHVPLPPYIARPDNRADRDRYQTVYGRQVGSIAAPTAGLHFTDGMLDALVKRGIEILSVTLHVGYGTFKPVRVEEVEAHTLEPERYEVSPSVASALSHARQSERRIIAVGSTTTRVLESLVVDPAGIVLPATAETSAFIYPGHRFRIVTGLVTNFHLPRSSLLMLVAAFGGRELVLRAYREAVNERYRFYSYGDAMFVV